MAGGTVLVKAPVIIPGGGGLPIPVGGLPISPPYLFYNNVINQNAVSGTENAGTLYQADGTFLHSGRIYTVIKFSTGDDWLDVHCYDTATGVFTNQVGSGVSVFGLTILSIYHDGNDLYVNMSDNTYRHYDITSSVPFPANNPGSVTTGVLVGTTYNDGISSYRGEVRVVDIVAINREVVWKYISVTGVGPGPGLPFTQVLPGMNVELMLTGAVGVISTAGSGGQSGIQQAVYLSGTDLYYICDIFIDGLHANPLIPSSKTIIVKRDMLTDTLTWFEQNWTSLDTLGVYANRITISGTTLYVTRDTVSNYYLSFDTATDTFGALGVLTNSDGVSYHDQTLSDGITPSTNQHPLGVVGVAPGVLVGATAVYLGFTYGLGYIGGFSTLSGQVTRFGTKV